MPQCLRGILQGLPGWRRGDNSISGVQAGTQLRMWERILGKALGLLIKI